MSCQLSHRSVLLSGRRFGFVSSKANFNAPPTTIATSSASASRCINRKSDMCSLLDSRRNTAHSWSKLWQPTAHGIRWPRRGMSRGISGRLAERSRTPLTQKCTHISSMESLHPRWFRCIFRLRKKLKIYAQMRSLAAFSTCPSSYLPIGEFDVASSLHLQLFGIMFAYTIYSKNDFFWQNVGRRGFVCFIRPRWI